MIRSKAKLSDGQIILVSIAIMAILSPPSQNAQSKHAGIVREEDAH